ncbi:HAD family hydrolase [Sulfurimonas sp.]|nr:HAD family hydrolase [Sulfurimonas sp.]
MKKALFLDRDGVINIEKDYLYKIEDFEFIDGIFELCQYYMSQDYIIIVVTNQSGIARDYYTQKQFENLTSWMIGMFDERGVDIQHVYHCPHHPTITGTCTCRKPEPGMLLNASKEYDVDLENSIIIGDKESDIEAGLNAGLTCTYLFNNNSTCKDSKATKIVSKLEEIYNANTK